VKGNDRLRQFIKARAPKVQQVNETINNLQSLIEHLSNEAEVTRRRRQSSTDSTVIGMRTEERAQIKAVNTAERNFKKLVATLESQFEQIKI
jgi:prefoldin subunit 5